MIFRILRHCALPALLAAAVTPACSGSPASAKALVKSYLQQSSTGGCPFGSRQEWIDVGVETGSQPTLVGDGDAQAGGTVSVTCTVHPNGGGFDLSLSAVLASINGGSISIQSNTPVTSTGGMGISGTFEGMHGLRFASDSCTLTYMYENGAVPDSTPIAGGRVWGHISCLDAQSMVSNIGADGGSTPESCDAEADVIFENCGS